MRLRAVVIMVAMLIASSGALRAGEHIVEVPVIRIGSKTYCEDDLVGTTRAQLREEFDREAKGMPLEHLQQRWKAYGGVPKGSNKVATDRAALEESVFHQSCQLLFRRAVVDVVHAALYDAIAQAHALEESVYFKVPVLRGALDRELDYFGYAYETSKEDESKDRGIYEEAKRRFGLSKPYEEWLVVRRASRNRPGFGQWTIRRYRTLEFARDLRVKAELVRDLLNEVCDIGGCFYESAVRTREERDNGEYIFLRINGYRGGVREMQSLIGTIFSSDGLVAQGGLERVMSMFQKLGPSVAFELSSFPGWQVADEDRWPHSEMVQVGRSAYHVTALRKRQSFTEESRKNLHSVFRQEASVLAAKEFLPDIEVKADDLGLDVPNMLRSLADDHQFYVSMGDYVRQPYPKAMFAFDSSLLHSEIATSLRLIIAGNVDEIRAHVKELIARAETVEPRPLKVAFLRIAEDLSRGKLGTGN